MEACFVKDFYQELVLDRTKIVISINFQDPDALGRDSPEAGF